MSASSTDEPRRLLLFAPAEENPSLARQRELLAGAEGGIRDRDLRVRYLTGEEPEAADARRRYGVAADVFEALLVGRDGGVKLRSGAPIPAEELFSRIDEMPMRRREMREHGGDSGGWR